MRALDEKLIAKVMPQTRQHNGEHEEFLRRGCGAEGWRKFAFSAEDPADLATFATH